MKNGLLVLSLVVLVGCSYSGMSREEKKVIKTTRFIRNQPVQIYAAKHRKMFSYWLYLREHQLFDFRFESNHYTCGTYQFKGDTLRFAYFNSDPLLTFEYGIINREESLIHLFKFNQKDTLTLNIEQYKSR